MGLLVCVPMNAVMLLAVPRFLARSVTDD